MNNVPVGQPFHVTNLTAGTYDETNNDSAYIDLSQVNATLGPQAPALAPDPQLPYVLAVAENMPQTVSVDESKAHFKIYVIAAVTHDWLFPFGNNNSVPWVVNIANEQAEKYDAVVPVYWDTLTFSSKLRRLQIECIRQ